MCVCVWVFLQSKSERKRMESWLRLWILGKKFQSFMKFALKVWKVYQNSTIFCFKIGLPISDLRNLFKINFVLNFAKVWQCLQNLENFFKNLKIFFKFIIYLTIHKILPKNFKFFKKLLNCRWKFLPHSSYHNFSQSFLSILSLNEFP